MNRYHVFYTFYADDSDSVDHEDPVSLSLGEIRDKLLPRLVGDGDFLGLVEARGHTFQVLYDADKHLYQAEVIEAPRPDDRRQVYHVYGGWLDRAALARTLERLPATFDRTDFPDFTEQSL